MNIRRTLAAGSAAALLVLVPAGAFASHGDDDGPNHDRGDDHPSSTRPGDDDGPNHKRHGDDDGPNHKRHGDDDGPGHHRHGNDDGPNHH